MSPKRTLGSGPVAHDFGRPWRRDTKYEVILKNHKDFRKMEFLDWYIDFKSSSLETDKHIDLTTTYDRSL